MHYGLLSFSLVILLTLSANTCCKQSAENAVEDVQPIEISVPSNTSAESSIAWNAQNMHNALNECEFSLRCLRNLYGRENGSSFVFSPLSLQYALSMVQNGASGETASEITKALGYEDGESLSLFMSSLMSQLPAVDRTVDLRLVNAMMVNRSFRVKEDFRYLLETSYFAPVEYLDASQKAAVVGRLNEWASLNTNGFIKQIVSEDDVPQDFVAMLLNALYFKAKWFGDDYNPMFKPEATQKSRPFFLEGKGKEIKVDYLRTSRRLKYAERDTYKAVEIPYAGNKYAMYVLLPVDNSSGALKAVLEKLTIVEWSSLLKSLRAGPDVHLSLPKIENEIRVRLVGLLKDIGVNKAFDPGASQFDRLIDAEGHQSYCISDVLQKARISVTEWGTEAAAVTYVTLIGDAGPSERKKVYFEANHPFAYFIAERESGLILFEGVFTGKE